MRNLTIDGASVQAASDTVDVIVPPRTRHAFTISCGAKSFADQLFVERPPEHAFDDIQLRLVAGWIDVGVGSLPDPGIFLGHVVHAWMRAERHVGAQRAHHFVRALEFVDDLRSVLVVH